MTYDSINNNFIHSSSQDTTCAFWTIKGFRPVAFNNKIILTKSNPGSFGDVDSMIIIPASSNSPPQMNIVSLPFSLLTYNTFLLWISDSLIMTYTYIYF